MSLVNAAFSCSNKLENESEAVNLFSASWRSAGKWYPLSQSLSTASTHNSSTFPQALPPQANNSIDSTSKLFTCGPYTHKIQMSEPITIRVMSVSSAGLRNSLYLAGAILTLVGQSVAINLCCRRSPGNYTSSLSHIRYMEVPGRINLYWKRKENSSPSA